MSNQLQPNMPSDAWHIVSQQETMQVVPPQGATRGVMVYFSTPTGLNGSVFVPDAQYNPANVKAAIAARVHQMNLVQGLTGPGGA